MNSNTWQINRDLSKPQSGVPGITWNKAKGGWRVRCTRVASISLDGGDYDSLSEAVSARRSLKMKCDQRKPIVFLPPIKATRHQARRMRRILADYVGTAELDDRDLLLLEKVERWLANLVTL